MIAPDTYRSTYTMFDGGETIFVQDMITWTAADELAVGTGETDGDGLTMNIELGAKALKGIWQEKDTAGKVVYSGEADFIMDDNRLFGYWTSGTSGEVTAGTWFMEKAN